MTGIKQIIWLKAACRGALLALGLTLALASTAQAADVTPTTIGGALGLSAGSKTTPLSADTSSAAKLRLEKDAVCTQCHDEQEMKPIFSIYQTPHGAIGDPRTPGCVDCHGKSEEHRTGKGNEIGHRPSPDRIFGQKGTLSAHFKPIAQQAQADVCMGCHKGGLRMRWPGSQHESNDVICTNCHVIHSPADAVRVKETQPTVCFTCHKDRQQDFKKISAHPVTQGGKLTCSDCHNPHGSPGPKLLVKNTVPETCFQCHADKRGPFLWEHQPVNEDCTNCHNPHGSNITPLLKSRPPFLCDECHNGPHNSVLVAGTSVAGAQGGGVAAGAAPNVFVTGRACLNCHAMVHGSNSPTGAFLHH